MALRKQPDRRVKQKRIIKMPENLDITRKKRKVVEPGVEMKFKMAARKQPDRQVKKIRKLEIPDNSDITKKKRKLESEEPRNFDIIGTLMCNYGMTGENLVRKMFSYMDVSSLQQGHLTCKTWNLFLVNDKKLWMDILRQTRPYFEFLSKQLLSDKDVADAETKIWKKYFDFVEKNDNYCCHKIIQVFKRIQMIHILLQDVIQAFPLHKVFQKGFIGEKLSGEIQMQIDSAEKKKQPNSKIYVRCGNPFELNFAGLLELITKLKVRREEIRCQKSNSDLLQYDQEYQNLYQEYLEASREEHKSSKQLLLGSVGITIFCMEIHRREFP